MGFCTVPERVLLGDLSGVYKDFEFVGALCIPPKKSKARLCCGCSQRL